MCGVRRKNRVFVYQNIKISTIFISLISYMRSYGLWAIFWDFAILNTVEMNAFIYPASLYTIGNLVFVNSVVMLPCCWIIQAVHAAFLTIHVHLDGCGLKIPTKCNKVVFSAASVVNRCSCVHLLYKQHISK